MKNIKLNRKWFGYRQAAEYCILNTAVLGIKLNSC
jgi:hypothetical protein